MKSSDIKIESLICFGLFFIIGSICLIQNWVYSQEAVTGATTIAKEVKSHSARIRINSASFCGVKRREIKYGV